MGILRLHNAEGRMFRAVIAVAFLLAVFSIQPAQAYWTTDYAERGYASAAPSGGALRANVLAFYDRVTEAAAAAGVPLNIAHAVVRMESGYNPRARSIAGAIGIMQVLPRTARAMGENPYTVDGNLRAGMKYLRLALDSSSNLCAAISAYEHGLAVRHPYCAAYGIKVMAMAGISYGGGSRAAHRHKRHRYAGI